MATTALDSLFHGIRDLAVGKDGAIATDAELLAAYLARRDQAAFALIVRRHGPMVLGVCRRILQNDDDAEDAFQATFLVLVRKASAIRHKALLGNWLYGVAHNTAIKAKATMRRRQRKESEAGGRAQTQTSAAVWQRLQALLDDELRALSDKDRAAVVLCDLEGKTIKEAARQLGWPQGTLATRLARGRALLAKRLAGHGLTFSASGLATLLSENATAAALSPGLGVRAVEAAAAFHAGAAAGVVSGQVLALTESVLKSMSLSKLRLAAGVFMITCMLAAGGALFAHLAAPPDPQPHVDGGRGGAQERAVDPPNAPPRLALQPGWKGGEDYLYSVRIEAGAGASTYTGVRPYRAASRVDGDRTRDRYDLVAEAEGADGAANCLVRQYDVAPGAKPEAAVDPLERTGDGYLFAAVGHLALLTALPPATQESQTWTIKSDCILKESVRVDPLKPHPRETILHPAEEVSVFRPGEKSGDIVVIHKTYSLETRDNVDGQPYVKFAGEGTIVFDRKAGLARALEFSGILHQAGVRAGVPITVSHKLLEGEERAKAIAERQETLRKAAELHKKLLENGEKLRKSLGKK